MRVPSRTCLQLQIATLWYASSYLVSSPERCLSDQSWQESLRTQKLCRSMKICLSLKGKTYSIMYIILFQDFDMINIKMKAYAYISKGSITICTHHKKVNNGSHSNLFRTKRVYTNPRLEQKTIKLE